MWYVQRFSRFACFLNSHHTLLRFLDAIHFAFAVHAVYHYNVTNFMNPANIGNTIWRVSFLVNRLIWLTFVP